MCLYLKPALSYVPIFQYVPFLNNHYPPYHLPFAEKLVSLELFGPQKWYTYQNVVDFPTLMECRPHMCLFLMGDYYCA